MKQKLIIIVGPTASGKSDLAVKIAKRINGEVISADSRQVYKGLNIGTGKITEKETAGVKHYLLDVADPKEIFTVVDFVRLAEKAVVTISEKNKTPIICGGTGFYIQALVDGLVIPEVLPDEKLRSELSKKTDIELLEMLEKLDPIRYENIDKNNTRRVIRAIEIATKIGHVPPLKKTDKYEPIFIGINMPMEILRDRIHKRLLDRLNIGMVEEIKNLHKQGLSWKRMEQLGLEYRYISRYLRKQISKKEMLEQLEIEICHYAKRQMTWFKKDKRINWV